MENNQVEKIESVIDDMFTQNEDPSIIFINNLQILYRLSKDEFINNFKTRKIKIIYLLREQMYYIFLDHFDDEILVKNGFVIKEDSRQHLRKRFKTLNAIMDIYNIGLSIL